MSAKLTQKEKRKTKRIEKKLTTKICTEVNSFGDCICPHCGFVIMTIVENGKIIDCDKCEKCGKKIIFIEDITKDVIDRQKRIQQLLEKVQNIEYGKIDVIEAGIDEHCDINEVALLCKYFQCGIKGLSACVKAIIIRKEVPVK